MKRLLAAVLTVVLLAGMCILLTGCDSPSVRVDSVMTITKEFKGTRTVSVVYPLNADIDAIKDDIIGENPAAEVDGADFSYVGATEDGYTFELKFTFDDLAAYEAQVSAVLGRSANAVLSCKDTVMFSGTRMMEDFDVKELVDWIARDTASNESTKDYTFSYTTNKVTIGSDTYDTGTTVSVSEGKGIPISSIEVKTYNEKTGLTSRLFDRSFVFAIPADTYTEYKRKINEYFEGLVGEDAQIADTHEGNNVLFSVTYEGLNLADLETATAAVLDSDGVGIYYGDKDSLSTPLYEGRVLEETLDTLSFDSPSGTAPTLKYTYSLPTNTVRGEGALYQNGSWRDSGTWDDGAFRIEDETGFTHLRIYDGRQYVISGVDIKLTSLGDEQFRRVTSFLYPIDNGFEGPVYAAKFFKAKGGETLADNDGENIICSVTVEGTIDEVNTAIENIFGKGNYLAYERKNGALSDKTTLTDYIDLRQMMSIENAGIEMTYHSYAENGENIVTVTKGGAETAYGDPDSDEVSVKGFVATFGYHGVIPKAGNILFYIIFGAVLFGITTLLAYRMLIPPIRREREEHTRINRRGTEAQPPAQLPAEQDEVPSYAPQQTTTFSIFELGILGRNKKYVDEINKDVENRLNANRLEERKKELRRKELEEMEKKVYGEKPAEEKEPAAPVDDSPRTQEILDTFDQAMKQEPQAPEATDPMELLDLVNGEDDDA